MHIRSQPTNGHSEVVLWQRDVSYENVMTERSLALLSRRTLFVDAAWFRGVFGSVCGCPLAGSCVRGSSGRPREGLGRPYQSGSVSLSFSMKCPIAPPTAPPQGELGELRGLFEFLGFLVLDWVHWRLAALGVLCWGAVGGRLAGPRNGPILIKNGFVGLRHKSGNSAQI